MAWLPERGSASAFARPALVQLAHVSIFQPDLDGRDRRMLREVALRSSQGLIVMRPLENLARADAALLVDGVTAILFHGAPWSCRAAWRAISMATRVAASPKWVRRITLCVQGLRSA